MGWDWWTTVAVPLVKGLEGVVRPGAGAVKIINVAERQAERCVVLGPAAEDVSGFGSRRIDHDQARRKAHAPSLFRQERGEGVGLRPG